MIREASSVLNLLATHGAAGHATSHPSVLARYSRCKEGVVSKAVGRCRTAPGPACPAPCLSTLPTSSHAPPYCPLVQCNLGVMGKVVKVQLEIVQLLLKS